MANIYVKDCADTEVGQKWEVKADGRIAVSGSSPRKRRWSSPCVVTTRADTESRGVHRPAVHEGHEQQPRRPLRLRRPEQCGCGG